MNVLVTGGAGRLGSKVAKVLTETGYRVRKRSSPSVSRMPWGGFVIVAIFPQEARKQLKQRVVARNGMN